MRLLIIEDELHNAQHLIKLLGQYNPHLQIEGPLGSVSAVLEWFANSSPPDLILMDIQLADGLSFEIFQEVSIQAPVIFITAYDNYAVKAFELNGLDYLLKPVRLERLRKAMDKYQNIFSPGQINVQALDRIAEALRVRLPAFKSRFLVKAGTRLVVVQTERIVGFLKDEIVLMVTEAGKRYAVDHSLDELGRKLDPKDFFRINRQCIVNAHFIREMRVADTQLILTMEVPFSRSLVVSQRNTGAFKKWLNEMD